MVNHEFGHVLGAGHDDFIVPESEEYCHLTETHLTTKLRMEL